MLYLFCSFRKLSLREIYILTSICYQCYISFVDQDAQIELILYFDKYSLSNSSCFIFTLYLYLIISYCLFFIRGFRFKKMKKNMVEKYNFRLFPIHFHPYHPVVRKMMNGQLTWFVMGLWRDKLLCKSEVHGRSLNLCRCVI